MKAKIKNKKEVAEGTLLVEFDLLGEEVNFEAGQYFFVTLVDPLYSDSKGSQRHLSMVNSPNEKDVLTIVTRLRDTAFKKSISEMSVGSDVEIGETGGDFILPKDHQKLVFIAGGIGITPFMSMLKYIKEEDLSYEVILLYSNRNRESTAFLEELEKMSEDNPKLKLVLTMTDDPEWEGEKSMIDEQFIKKHIPDFESYYYMIAGPPVMVNAINDLLTEIGINKKNKKPETFSGY